MILKTARCRFEAAAEARYLWGTTQFRRARRLSEMPREHEGGGLRRNHDLGQQL
jgi:hypothetical protein